MPNELNLNSKTEVLRVKIGDKSFDVPLATSLPYKEVKSLVKLTKKTEVEEQMDVFVEFFKNHIDPDVIDNLPMSALTELAKAWSGASETEGGESLGKSSASEV